jgi:hypothetical protein
MYSAVVAGLNKELKAKFESTGDEEVVRFDEEGNELIWVIDGWSPKKWFVFEDEEPETSYSETSKVTSQNTIQTGTANSSQISQAVRPSSVNASGATPIVEFAPSVSRPGWVRTRDEYMVLEFGSTGPITLRRSTSSS